MANNLFINILFFAFFLPSYDSFRPTNYDVFLSFRGADTRYSFTSHLYEALKDAGIRTFMDDDGIPIGRTIDLGIKRAIEASKLSLVVFSREFASSSWCLDEVVLIMERNKTVGHKVLPVFYEVKRAEVGKQTGGYGKAFTEHKKKFRGEKERVERWRQALKEVADMGGKELGEGYEADFIESIVAEVRQQLNLPIPSLLPIRSSTCHPSAFCHSVCYAYCVGQKDWSGLYIL